MEKYQTIGLRFVALIIDGVVMIPVGILASAFVAYNSNPRIALLSQSFIGLISVFYYILFHFKFGQTLGKMVMKVKVLDITEKQITFTQAVIRSLPQMFPLFAGASLINISTRQNPDYDAIQIAGILITAVSWIWHIADIIVCLVSEKKRALHDFIAGTVVVKTNADQISVTP